MKKLVRILPFMEREEIKELANEIINGEVEGVKLVMLFPFLQNEDLDEIVDLLIEKKDTKSLQHALPFARKATIDKIYKAVQSGDLVGMKETFFYPFLGKDQLKGMFRILVKEAKKDADQIVEVEIDVDGFDIDLEGEEDEVNVELDTLKQEMKALKEKLKKYQK